MSIGIMIKEQMEEYLVRKYRERLKKIVWGKNTFSLTEALKFTTEAMMEVEWSDEQKEAFKNFLLSTGFKARREGKKSEEVRFIWYFPAEGKSERLVQIYSEYKDSMNQAEMAFRDKATQEIENFCNESCNITVVKTDNLWYFRAFEEAMEKEENISVKLFQHVTEHEDWVILSKTGIFYDLPNDYEEKFQESVTFYVKNFLDDLNRETENYHNKKLRRILPEDKIVLSNKYVTYLPISAHREFVRIFESLGFKFTFFPNSYESDYTLLGLRIPYLIEVFVTIDVPKKVKNLGYGEAVNEAYRKFCEIYH